jgi:hypothetical protein
MATFACLHTATREVWQYWAYNTSPPPPWVAACTERRDDGLYVVRRSGKQLILPGEWLARDLDGEPEWLTDADFHRLYQIIKGN